MKPETLKYCRMLAGLSQTKAAEIVGVHQSLIAKIEAGTVPAQPELMFKLKILFLKSGVTTEEIQILTELFESRKYRNG